MFITLEGIDGSGKSTQIQFLAELFRDQGKKVLLTREPGGTALAEKLRHILLETQIGHNAELLLFGAARAQHVQEVISPALQRGAVVISDRFADSTLAYQGGGMALSESFIETMNRFVCDNLTPDITFLLDIDAKTSWNRRQQTKQSADTIESRGLDYLELVRQSYLKIARQNQSRIVVINGDQSPEDVWEEMKKQLVK